ncbi:MAG: DEAD/DEAH box helicase [Dissulfurispiraceae bacterium]
MSKSPIWCQTPVQPVFSLNLAMPEFEELSILMRIDLPEIYSHSCQIEHDAGTCLELISDREVIKLKLIKSALIVKPWNFQLIGRPKMRGHIFGSQEFDHAGPTYPCLFPHLGENFGNAAAFAENRALFDFQIFGATFLVRTQRGILADEMGLGKTVQAIIALRSLFQNAAIKTALIICPKSILTTWQKRLKEWAPELTVVAVENNRIERRLLWRKPAHVYLTSYETVLKDVKKEKAFDLLICDEIQKIKNPKTLVYQAASLIIAKRKWGLTGTPLENTIDDLISIFDFLKPGLLNRKERDAGIIKKKIRPYILRRRKIDVIPDLPPKLYQEVWLPLTESQKVMYEETKQKGLTYLNILGSEITVKHVLALITELKLLCNLNPVTNESSKLDYLKEKIYEIPRDDKILVYSQFPNKTLRHFVKEIKEDSLFYDGSLSLTERDKIIELFQNHDEHRILFISLKCAYGVNLTRANYVFHVDSWWNPAITAQAEDRAHRIGQGKTVYITYMYVRNTIEQRIHNLLNEKRELFDLIINDLTSEDICYKLTKDEIFGLLENSL